MKVTRGVTSGDIQLTPNFYLSEFLRSETASRHGLANVPDPLAVKNLYRVAQMMEEVRKLLGNKAIFISSGYRSPAVNRAVGGSRNSDHMRGEACDFVCRGFGTPLQVARKIAESKINFGQLIMEYDWVHISLPDGTGDRHIMTARFVNGEPVYSPGLPQ